MNQKERSELTDICCRLMSTSGSVTLNERIWLNTLCEKNEVARDLAGAMLCPDIIEAD
tara:strand:+ start:412 stop:585 length:174 start_codon:yes stop_codon:yes gene_type:complete